VLKKDGIYVTVGGNLTRLLQTVFCNSLISIFSKKRVKLLALKANKNLNTFNNLFITGKIKTVIDEPYAFEKIPWAFQRFGEGKHLGKIIITLAKVA
jgi:NADPH:quinone reductase-like Zn-dependent oxidoreductase